MSDHADIDRRRLLTWGAGAAALGVWTARAARPAGAQDAPAQHSGAVSFAVMVSGLGDASKNIREITIDELTVDAREVTDTGNVQVRMFRPGSVQYGSVRLTSVVSPGGPHELRAWFQDAQSGKNIRKNITVTLFDANNSPVRSFNLLDCFPTAYSSVNFDTSSTVQTETITVKMGRVEFKT